MADVFNLQAILGLDSSGFESGLAAAKKGITTATKVIGAAVATGTAATAAFAKSALSTGSEFDSAMSQIAATMGMTTEEIKNNVNGAGDTFDALRDKAKEMGSTTNFTATEAAEGLNILAMSGYDAAESMEMIEDVLHLAAAGSMDMASAAAYVAGNMKGFNDETKDSGYYADLMAKGATLANTSVSQLGEAMSGGAASAAAYGQSAESMTISLLRLAEQGEAGSAASTALAAAMKNLYTPTDQAAGALEELGVAAYDENGIAKDFNTVVNELAESLNGMSDAEANAYKDTIFGIQGLDAFNKMTVTGIEKQEEWAEALANAGEGAGEAAKQYDTMTDNLQGDIDIFNSTIDGLKIAVSDSLSGSAREFVQFGSNAISSISEGFENGGIDGAMEALSQVLQEAIAMLTEKLPVFLDAGVKLISALLQGIVQNAPQIVAAIVNILPVILDAIIGLIPSLLSAVTEIMTTLIGGLETAIPLLLQGIAENTPKIVGALVELLPLLLETIAEFLPSILETAITVLESVMNGLGELMPTLLPIVINAVIGLVDLLLEHIPEFLQVGMDMLVAIFNGVVEALPTLLEYLPTLVTTIGDTLVESMPIILEAAIQLLMALIEALPVFLPMLINAYIEIITTIQNVLLDSLPLLVEAGITLFTALTAALPQIIVELVKAVPVIVENLVNKFKALFGKIKTVGIDIFKQLVTGMKSRISSITEAVGLVKTALLNKFKEIKDDALTWGKDMLDNFIQGIKDKIETLKDTVSDIAGSIKELLGFSEPEKGPLSNFHTYAPDMMDLFAKGIKDNEDVITSAISDAFDIGSYLTGRTKANTVEYKAQEKEMQPIVIENKVYLEGDAKGVFKLVDRENRINTRATGRNTLAMS